MSAPVEIPENVKAALAYLADGGLAEVTAMTNAAMAGRTRTVKVDASLAMALCYLAAERDALRADVQRLTDALAAADKGWQPIETAPRDGTEILIWPGPYGSVIAAVRGKYFWDVRHLGVAACKLLTPTHWQPLPAPPALTGAAS